MLIGFVGTIFVAKPTFFQANPFIILIFFVASYNAFTHVIVSKYSGSASTYAYTFYNLLPLFIFCFIFNIVNPIYINYFAIILILTGGTFLFFAAFFLTLVFQYAGKFSRFLSPFFYIQIVWSSLFAKFIFNEDLDNLAIFGILLITISGTLTILNTPKIRK